MVASAARGVAADASAIVSLAFAGVGAVTNRLTGPDRTVYTLVKRFCTSILG